MIKNVLWSLVIAFLLMKGCAGVKKNRNQVQGVEIPFYKKTTYSVDLLDKNKTFTDTFARKFYYYHLKILKGVLDGNLKSYHSSDLNDPYSLEKIRSRGNVEGYQKSKGSIAQAEFRKNFIENIDRRRFIEYKVTSAWNWKGSKDGGKMQFFSLAPVFKPTAGGVSLGKQPLCYIEFEKLSEILSSAEMDKFRNLIRKKTFNHVQSAKANEVNLKFRAQNHSPGKFVTKRELIFQDSDGLKGELGRMFQKVHFEIYRGARKGQIKGYINDSLSSYFSPEEVKKQGAEKELVTYHPDPTDYRYKRDSVVYNYLDKESINRYWILESWEPTDDGGYKIKPFAMAVSHKPERGGITLNATSLFWVKLKDLDQVLNKAQNNWLHKYLYLTLQRKVAVESSEI